MHVISLLVIVLPMQYFPQIFFYMVIEKKTTTESQEKKRQEGYKKIKQSKNKQLMLFQIPKLASKP